MSSRRHVFINMVHTTPVLILINGLKKIVMKNNEYVINHAHIAQYSRAVANCYENYCMVSQKVLV